MENTTVCGRKLCQGDNLRKTLEHQLSFFLSFLCLNAFQDCLNAILCAFFCCSQEYGFKWWWSSHTMKRIMCVMKPGGGGENGNGKNEHNNNSSQLRFKFTAENKNCGAIKNSFQ
jgi:hypothetical protein